MQRIALILTGALLAIGAQAAGPGGENAIDLSAYATKDAVTAIQSRMPAAGTATPPATAIDSATGSSSAYARADHTHAARVQRTVLTTATDGTATWTFARPIVVAAGKLPPIAYMVEDTGSPVVVQIVARASTSDGTNDTHTAITVKAQRSRTLPAVLVSLASLLSFDVFGTVANGVKVNLWAADPTQ